jgi:ApaG protein
MAEQEAFPPTPFVATTHEVRVSVHPQYSPEHSSQDVPLFVYLYTILIENLGLETVQVLSRHWVITDGFNQVENIIGEGIIGQKPVIPPGKSFTYTSSCPLKTPTGSMKGRYQMRAASDKLFDVDIPEFMLADRNLVN